jgi:hypothetical protein
MDGADPSESARRETSIRGQLAELTERQGWGIGLQAHGQEPVPDRAA